MGMGEENKINKNKAMRRRTTLKEMATILNLSVSTVSKALANSDEISTRTKNRVKQTARDLNYRSNKLAQILKQGVTKSIGVIVPSIIDDFYALVLTGIEKYLTQEGYSMVVFISHGFENKEADAIKTLSAGIVDAIILSHTEKRLQSKTYHSMLKDLEEELPIIVFGRGGNESSGNFIFKSQEGTAKEIIKYLIHQLETKEILLIGSQHASVHA